MSKLRFNYSTMNAGKSTQLLQAVHNYESNGSNVLVFSYDDKRFSEDCTVTSRLGLSRKAIPFNDLNSFYNYYIGCWEHKSEDFTIDAIFIDEAQFLTEGQINSLLRINYYHSCPILCYGLKSDFLGNLFPGSEALLKHADVINELKSMCSQEKCQNKAMYNLRKVDGDFVKEGEQLVIGDESYHAVCKNHFFEIMKL